MAYEYLLDKYREYYRQFPRIAAFRLTVAAKYYYNGGFRSKAVELFKKAICFNPTDIWNYCYLIFSWLVPVSIYRRLRWKS